VIVTSRVAGFAQTKSLEAKNSNLLQPRYLSNSWPSFQLPKKNNKKGKGRGRGKKGNRGNRDRDLITGRGNVNSLSAVVERWMPLFPARTTKVLRYSGNAGLSAASGVVTTYVLRANDCFDPDFTGTGHQPMGFDQMMVFYNHFCVVSCKIVVTFKCASGNECTAAIRYDASSSPLTTIDRIIEYGGLTMVELEAAGGFGSHKVLTASVDIAKIQGVSRSAITADPTLRGDTATSPSEVTYWHLAIWSAAATTCTADISFIMEMKVVFLEPRDATES
jgi:hypothetical protein